MNEQYKRELAYKYTKKYKYEKYKGTHEFIKRKLERLTRGPGRMWLWMIDWGSTLPLRYSDHTLPAPRSGRENPGESNDTPQASVEGKPSGEAG